MYLKHENIVCNSTILIAYSSLGHTAELVGIYMYRIRAWSCHGSIFTNILPLINLPYWIYLYCSKRIIQSFLHKLSCNKKLSSKFLCEEDN